MGHLHPISLRRVVKTVLVFGGVGTRLRGEPFGSFHRKHFMGLPRLLGLFGREALLLGKLILPNLDGFYLDYPLLGLVDVFQMIAVLQFIGGHSCGLLDGQKRPDF